MSLLHHVVRREPLAQLSRFREEFYACLTARSDAWFELADTVPCGDGPMRSLAELSLVGEHRRGHGGLYAAVARGCIDAGDCGGHWPKCHCHAPPTAGWSWPSMSPDGCGPTPTPHRNASHPSPAKPHSFAEPAIATAPLLPPGRA